MKPAVLVCAVALSGCGYLESPCGDGGMEAQRMLLLATDVEFARVASEQDMGAAFAEYIDPGAVFLPMNFQTLYGREEIARFLDGTSGLQFSWTPADAEVAASCDVGYSFGAWTVDGVGPEGDPVQSDGKYLGVWRRGEQGWRLTVYMQNLDPPRRSGPAEDGERRGVEDGAGGD